MDQQTTERMEGLLNVKKLKIADEAIKVIIAELKTEGFDEADIVHFLKVFFFHTA